MPLTSLSLSPTKPITPIDLSPFSKKFTYIYLFAYPTKEILNVTAAAGGFPASFLAPGLQE